MKWLSIIVLWSVWACGSDSEPKVQTTPVSKYADIIRNPLSAQGDIDSNNVAKMSFEEIVFDFDTIMEGTVVQHTFHFTNTGKKPLSIMDARSTCGCTIAHYPKEIIESGQKGSIKASFDSNGKTFDQDKPITIYANTLPQKTVVRMRGFVIPKTQKK